MYRLIILEATSPRSRCLQGWFSSGLSPWPPSCCVLSWSFLCACVPLVSPLVSTFPLRRTHPYGDKLESTLTTSFPLTSLKTLSPNIVKCEAQIDGVRKSTNTIGLPWGLNFHSGPPHFHFLTLAAIPVSRRLRSADHGGSGVWGCSTSTPSLALGNLW